MRIPVDALDWILAGFALVLGAIVGSFLNVVIYRLPRNLSVNEPKRSFCPSCNTQIPWHQNLPLFSWLLLRGRCAKCGVGISFRYFMVELLTALLFLAIWLSFPMAFALPYWIFAGLLISATFIDFEHFIIPDEITYGGVVSGVLMCLVVPRLMDTTNPFAAAGWSLLGALVGWTLLRGVVEAGKLAFGKKRTRWEEPAALRFEELQDDWLLHLGEEKLSWSDTFGRKSDKLILEVKDCRIREKTHGDVELVCFWDRVTLAGNRIPDDQLQSMTGTVVSAVIPREAMGLGDVKFIAAIGAFLGWQAVLFTIFAASLIGSLVGVVTIVLRHREWSGRIPFGPYLALGALLWMFAGPALVVWYLGLLQPQF